MITTAGPDDRAGALATFFTAGYAGVSLPVVGAGLALQHLSPRVTLLIFALAVAIVILAVTPILVRPAAGPAPRLGPDSHPMTALCRGFGEHAGRPESRHRDQDTAPEREKQSFIRQEEARCT